MMKRLLVLIVGSMIVGTTLTPEPAWAQKRRPIQIALVAPVQIFPDDDAITGLRLNLLYGRNAYFRGLDLGLVNHTTSGVSKGVQSGVVNVNDTDLRGWQDGWVNVTSEKFEGFQSGIVNVAGRGGGFQYAVVNHARQFRGFQLGAVNYGGTFGGLQLGLVNYAGRYDGLQIGVINIIREGGAFPVFPIVNWSFD